MSEHPRTSPSAPPPPTPAPASSTPPPSTPPPIRTGRPLSTPLPDVVLTRELSSAAAHAALRSGALERIRTGAYRRRTPTPAPAPHAPPIPKAAAARELALARIAAVSRQLRTPFWFSHTSAALIWGCAAWSPGTQTHLIQTFPPHGHGDPGLARHRIPLEDADRVVWRGVPLTSLDRTVIDCARDLPPLDALVIADSALRLGADRDAITGRIAALDGRRGITSARTVLEYADGRAESPWETYVRYLLVSRGLPRPELQVPIRTRLGWFRADLGWTQWRLLIEFDGFVKYAALARGDPARAVFEEKRRQDAIEEQDWRVLRVTAADLGSPEAFVGRVCRRLPAHVVASLVPIPELRAW